MKKPVVLLLTLLLFYSISAAQDISEKEKIETTIAKIEKEVERLEGRLSVVKSEKKIDSILDMIEGHEARIEKLKKQLEALEPPAAEPEPAAKEAPVKPAEDAVVQPEPEEIESKRTSRLEFEIGGSAGIYAGSTSVFGELRFALPYIFGPATTSLRLSGGLAQSEDTETRYAPVQVDGIFNFPAGWFTGVENYFGVGLNYVVRMTGRRTGDLGGAVSYGVESEGFGGKLFGEVGYGVLRSGFSPADQGVSCLVGYRRNWSL